MCCLHKPRLLQYYLRYRHLYIDDRLPPAARLRLERTPENSTQELQQLLFEARVNPLLAAEVELGCRGQCHRYHGWSASLTRKCSSARFGFVVSSRRSFLGRYFSHPETVVGHALYLMLLSSLLAICET